MGSDNGFFKVVPLILLVSIVIYSFMRLLISCMTCSFASCSESIWWPRRHLLACTTPWVTFINIFGASSLTWIFGLLWSNQNGLVENVASETVFVSFGWVRKEGNATPHPPPTHTNLAQSLILLGSWNKRHLVSSRTKSCSTLSPPRPIESLGGSRKL